MRRHSYVADPPWTSAERAEYRYEREFDIGPSSWLRRRVAQDLDGGKIWGVDVGPESGGVVTLDDLDPPSRHVSVDRLPDSTWRDDDMPDAWWDRYDPDAWQDPEPGGAWLDEDGDEPWDSLIKHVNAALAAAGFSGVRWADEPNPAYEDWLDEQPLPTRPMLLRIHDGAVQHLCQFEASPRHSRVRFVTETPELQKLRLTARSVAALEAAGLKPLSVDGLAAAMGVSRRLAAEVLLRSGDVYLYDPLKWDHLPTDRPAPTKGHRRRKETAADRIAAVLGQGSMTVADIATAIDATPEAALLTLKRGPFEQSDERPARWRVNTLVSQAP